MHSGSLLPTLNLRFDLYRFRIIIHESQSIYRCKIGCDMISSRIFPLSGVPERESGNKCKRGMGWGLVQIKIANMRMRSGMRDKSVPGIRKLILHQLKRPPGHLGIKWICIL
ncbi:hypothetical protein CDAR_93011 [Caerostris darwini]|uniref:Uncharacterized protein n=1 Tax=Caerostris darwini TaxID=1538125 RepID=A0AAV4WH69_9ARAC|nr:hypothetical protein CDAR_93011 [Caerostris darwini]